MFKQNKQAFTLIELLVVVLIIVILAAVALPQYQKAVEKIRLTEAITLTDSLKKSVEMYILTHGFPDSNVELLGDSNSGIYEDILDINVAETLDCSSVIGACISKNFVYDAYCLPSKCYVRGKRYSQPNATDQNKFYHIYLIRDEKNWKRQCHILSSQGEKFCNSLPSTQWEILDERG